MKTQRFNFKEQYPDIRKVFETEAIQHRCAELFNYKTLLKAAGIKYFPMPISKGLFFIKELKDPEPMTFHIKIMQGGLVLDEYGC